MMHKKMLMFILLLNLPLSWLAYSLEPLHVTTGFTAPVSDYFKKIFVEVKRRHPEIQISIEELSAERSLMLADQGVTDGECCRIPEVIKQQYPNLVAVPYPVYTMKWVAFSTKPLSITTWADLKHYSVATVRGWKLAENKIAELKPRNMEILRTPEQMMTLLQNGRTEVGVMGYMSGLKAIKDSGASAVKYVSVPLSVNKLYLMLNKRHKDLLPVLTRIFEEFAKDGTFERLYNSTVKPYLL